MFERRYKTKETRLIVFTVVPLFFSIFLIVALHYKRTLNERIRRKFAFM